jgi:hypothetical protein
MGWLGMPGGPFTVLTHIDQERFGIGRQALARFFQRNLADGRTDLINQLQKAG